MARLSKKVLSFFKQVLVTFTPNESESAWDDYRRARMLAQPVKTWTKH